ncbi:MAG: regulatory protein RecX [Chloroflexi bacterium]|nr:MAG: regulatory protein RecX [Chloroflexota bacterium]
MLSIAGKAVAGTITRLVYQKNNRRRVNVYLDDSFAFALPDEEAARLSIGQYLSDDDIAGLRRRDQAAKAFDRAARLLAHRPRSQHEIETHLRKAGFDADAITHALERLRRLQLVDDRSFVDWWIDNRSRFSPRGVQALRHELREKGVAPELIERALQAVDEGHLAVAAGAKRAARWQNESREAFFKKMFGFLQRRGFPYPVARQATETLWERYGRENSDELILDT